MFEKKMIGSGAVAGGAIGALFGGPLGAGIGSAVGAVVGAFTDEAPEKPIAETPSEKRLRELQAAKEAQEYAARQRFLQQRDYDQRERAAAAKLSRWS